MSALWRIRYGVAMAEARRVALVTGGAIRVGAAIVRALAAAGYRVWIHYNRSAGPAEALARELGPGCAGVVQADLAISGERARLAEQVLAAGGLDLLVNSAASFERGEFEERGDADLERVLAVNLIAPLSLVRALLPGLRRAEAGVVVNIVDLAAFHPWVGYADHCASKAALVMATRALAVELAPSPRVVGIAPGTVMWPEDDPRFADEGLRARIARAIPLGRIGRPEDVAQAVVFLAANSFINGVILPVDGGRLAAAAGEG